MLFVRFVLFVHRLRSSRSILFLTMRQSVAVQLALVAVVALICMAQATPIDESSISDQSRSSKIDESKYAMHINVLGFAQIYTTAAIV